MKKSIFTLLIAVLYIAAINTSCSTKTTNQSYSDFPIDYYDDGLYQDYYDDGLYQDYYDDLDSVSDDILLNEMLLMNIKFPYIVLAQAKLESGNYTSKIFLYNQNLFGMKQPWKRITTSQGSINGYAFYTYWRESLIDYALYQSTYYSNITTEEEYYDKLLSMGYARDTNYINKLKQIVKQIQ